MNCLLHLFFSKETRYLSFIVAAALGLIGCSTVGPLAEFGAAVGEATGTISGQQAESIKRSGAAVAKTAEDITPEQEYYIGRAVAATVLAQYKAYDADEANRYVNLLGQALARFSDMPETFAGYRFLVIDSDEINAFAAPGGLVMVSRGLIRCCPNEDALAAVLAHEIGHVETKHGLKAIKRGRLTSALTILAAEGAKSFGGSDIAELTTAFEGSVTDITSTLMNNGYSRALEYEADQAAVNIMRRAGYNPHALVEMLEQMQKNLVTGRHDFAATHPTPKSRIDKLRKQLGKPGPVETPPARQKRFEMFISKI